MTFQKHQGTHSRCCRATIWDIRPARWRQGRRRGRRGVLILVVLGLLVLFLLVAITFVINASQQHTSAKAVSRLRLTGNDPQEQLEAAMYQLVRDTTNPGSAVRNHSLLRDLYGSGVGGSLTAAPTSVAGGQFLDLAVSALPNGNIGFYDGCVLTFTSGPAKGVSTRIVSDSGATSATTLRIMRPEGPLLPANTDRFFINGRPFDGSAGNEDYDAADANNMFLAAVIPPDGTHPNVRVIRSFDRSQSGGASLTPTGFSGVPVDNDGDGIAESIWLDLGFPVQSHRDGRLYKPLFAFLCTDLDGRLNVNAHGAPAHVSPVTINPVTLAGGTSSSSLAQGQGYGPPEISLAGLMGGNYSALLDARYGAANVPGVAGQDQHSRVRLLGVPADYTTDSRSYGSVPDVRGRFALGLDTLGRPLYETAASGDETTDTAYELNLARDVSFGPGTTNTGDFPFTAGELEALLRRYDIDAAALPPRLRNFFNSGAVEAYRISVTTHGFDLPVPGVHPFARLTAAGFSASDARTLLAPELLMGARMNLNYPFGNGRDDNNNRVVDDDGEIGAAADRLWDNVTAAGFPVGGVDADRDNNGALDPMPAAGDAIGRVAQAKEQFAKQLFVLLWVLDGKPSNSDTVRDLAQWCVNVVDFRDADSIMTRFRYDENPADGWTATEEVWGCERPELLITETLAFHDRRTEDLDTDGGIKEFTDQHQPPTTPAGTDPHFDQHTRPRSGFFVELYNPWRGADEKPGEFYYHGGSMQAGVALQKKAGNSPVWRLLIIKKDSGDDDDPDDPDNPPAMADIERSVYFADPTAASINDDGDVQYYTTASIAPLEPGRFAVIGSAGELVSGEYTTYVGDKTTPDPATTRRIELNPSADTVGVSDNGYSPTTVPSPAPPVVAIPIDTPYNLSISEPTGAAGDPYYTSTNWDGATKLYTPPIDEPLDHVRATNDTDLEPLLADGTTVNFRTVHLQRLANPLAPWNSTTNPYRTVDSMSVDLTAFNGIQDSAVSTDPDVTASSGSDKYRFETIQRGTEIDATEPDNLWAHETLRGAISGNSAQGTGDHRFDFQLKHSLGFLNEAFGPPASANVPAQPFPWLTWLNRPYVSQAELMQVPVSSSSQLLRDFSFAGGTYRHLIDFYNSAAHRTLMEYVQVPSRFVGAETILSPTVFRPGGAAGVSPFYAPNNRVSNYRDPGRININTIYSADVWDAVMHNLAGHTAHPGPSFAQLIGSRRGDTATDILAAPGSGTTFFAAPFRGYSANSRNDTLLRDGPTAGTPLFAYASTANHNHTDRNPYFLYQGQQRITNLVTTRSNVFAVWITVGYFEVDQAGALNGRELGSDSGETERHRAFYIIDRSIPVAFEPGKNHNVDQAVLVRTFIE